MGWARACGTLRVPCVEKSEAQSFARSPVSALRSSLTFHFCAHTSRGLVRTHHTRRPAEPVTHADTHPPPLVWRPAPSLLARVAGPLFALPDSFFTRRRLFAHAARVPSPAPRTLPLHPPMIAARGGTASCRAATGPAPPPPRRAPSTAPPSAAAPTRLAAPLHSTPPSAAEAAAAAATDAASFRCNGAQEDRTAAIYGPRPPAPATLAVHGGEREGRPRVSDSLTTPLVQTSTYTFKVWRKGESPRVCDRAWN